MKTCTNVNMFFCTQNFSQWVLFYRKWNYVEANHKDNLFSLVWTFFYENEVNHQWSICMFLFIFFSRKWLNKGSVKKNIYYSSTYSLRFIRDRWNGYCLSLRVVSYKKFEAPPPIKKLLICLFTNSNIFMSYSGMDFNFERNFLSIAFCMSNMMTLTNNIMVWLSETS